MNNMDFTDHILNNSKNKIKNKYEIIMNLFSYLPYLIKEGKNIEDGDVLFGVGYINIFILILIKIGIVKYKKLIWWGFFFHSRTGIFIIRIFLRIFNCKELLIVVFSYYEKELYTQKKVISQTKLVSIPYGDWNNHVETLGKDINYGTYYFSGGYSNRDYCTLIKAFSKSSYRLIVVASSLNHDLDKIKTTDNVVILRDVTSEKFEELLRGAKACIFPFKNNLGASGQSVMLRCMRNRKLVITTKNNVIYEYIENGKSGIVINSIKDELMVWIEKIENGDDFEDLKIGLVEKYYNNFSFAKITKKLRGIIENC
ncbi:MAG: hypothetical protein AB9907_17675 [Flexilinea sp.]